MKQNINFLALFSAVFKIIKLHLKLAVVYYSLYCFDGELFWIFLVKPLSFFLL